MTPSKHPRPTTDPVPSSLFHTSSVSPFSAKIQDLTPPPSPPIRKYPIIIIVIALHIIILCISLWIPNNKPDATSPYMLELIDPTATPPPTQAPPPPLPTLPDPPTAERDPQPPPTLTPPPPPDPTPELSTLPEKPSTPPVLPQKTTPPQIKKNIPAPKPTPALKPAPKKPKIEISKEIVQKPPPSKTQSPAKTSPEAKTSTSSNLDKKSSSASPTVSRKSSPQSPTAPPAPKQDFTPYYALIREKMNRVWKQPIQYAHLDPRAVIRIRISTTGKILSATLEESSGIEEFDQSALAAATEAKEIGAARPPGMPESVTITFRLDSPD
jgi:TonB family protein